LRSGEGFKKLREERGVSQRKLTEGICARSTLATFENEGSHLSVELCSKLLDRLNIRIDTYFSSISEDFDQKREEFSELKKSIVTEDTDAIEKHKQNYLARYASTRDFYWFHLYFLSEEFLCQSETRFTYERFRETHKKDINLLEKYLNKIENWSHFEFAVFSNSIWYFDIEFIHLVKERLEKSYLTSVKYKKELYGSFLLNMGFYCLEYSHFELIKQLKEELFELSNYTNIHWKISSSYQLSLAGELSAPPSSSKAETLSHIKIYAQLGEEEHYDNMINYRQRLIEKHKKGETS